MVIPLQQDWTWWPIRPQGRRHQLRHRRRQAHSTWHWKVLQHSHWWNANECGRLDLKIKSKKISSSYKFYLHEDFLKPNYSRFTKKWKPLSWPNLFLSKPLTSSLSEWRKKWQKCKKLTVFSSILKILLQTLSVRVTKQFLISDKYLSVLSLPKWLKKNQTENCFQRKWMTHFQESNSVFYFHIM